MTRPPGKKCCSSTASISYRYPEFCSYNIIYLVLGILYSGFYYTFGTIWILISFQDIMHNMNQWQLFCSLTWYAPSFFIEKIWLYEFFFIGKIFVQYFFSLIVQWFFSHIFVDTDGRDLMARPHPRPGRCETGEGRGGPARPPALEGDIPNTAAGVFGGTEAGGG